MSPLYSFHVPSTTISHTLSLHYALPISTREYFPKTPWGAMGVKVFDFNGDGRLDLFVTDMHSDMSVTKRSDRKSTRLNSSHGYISYAVFCLKKKILITLT